MNYNAPFTSSMERQPSVCSTPNFTYASSESSDTCSTSSKRPRSDGTRAAGHDFPACLKRQVCVARGRKFLHSMRSPRLRDSLESCTDTKGRKRQDRRLCAESPMTTIGNSKVNKSGKEGGSRFLHVFCTFWLFRVFRTHCWVATNTFQIQRLQAGVTQTKASPCSRSTTYHQMSDRTA